MILEFFTCFMPILLSYLVLVFLFYLMLALLSCFVLIFLSYYLFILLSYIHISTVKQLFFASIFCLKIFIALLFYPRISNTLLSYPIPTLITESYAILLSFFMLSPSPIYIIFFS